MGNQSLAIPSVIPDDWVRLKLIVNKIKSRLGQQSSPTFTGLTITGLTASTIVGANADKALESITVGTGLDYTRPNLTLSHLGIEALTDPGGDRILFWDDSETACKWLTVGNSITITATTLDTIQDIRTTASPEFANLNLGTGELTAGSINRADGTLTIEIGGTAEISITSTTVTLGGNLIVPDAGQIGSTSDPDAITISATGIVDITAHNGSDAGLSLGGTLVTSTAAELNLLDGLSGVQAQGDVLDDLNTLGANPFAGDPDADFLVGTSAGTLAWQSGATARTSIGLGTGDSPTFTGLDLTGTLTVDTINEHTGAAGVTIEGILIKDSDIHLQDYDAIFFGDAQDAYIYFDETRLLIGSVSQVWIGATYDKALVAGNLFSNGNVNIGYTAMRHTWKDYYDVLEIGGTGALFCNTSVLANMSIGISQNAYFDDTDERWEYAVADEASLYTQVYGGHKFFVNAGAGAATGGAITFVNALDIADDATVTCEGASVTIGKASTTTGTLVLHDSNSANTITLTVPDISAGSLTFTLPATDGDNTNVLQTDGNGVLSWVAAGAGGGGDTYTDRGDPAAWDYTLVDFTTDGAWHDLDLSSIVTDSDATLVLISVIVQDNVANNSVQWRENGNSNSFNRALCPVFVANGQSFYNVLVGCDSNQVIEYLATNTTWTGIWMCVRGWWA